MNVGLPRWVCSTSCDMIVSGNALPGVRGICLIHDRGVNGNGVPMSVMA